MVVALMQQSWSNVVPASNIPSRNLASYPAGRAVPKLRQERHFLVIRAGTGPGTVRSGGALRSHSLANQEIPVRPAARGRELHPSLPAVLFLLWAVLIPPFEGAVMVNADGDPARHIRHGETILARGEVIRADPFSFTRPGAPFVGFEYGSQILLALAHRGGGTVGMAVLATLVIAGTIAGLAGWLLRRGLDPLLVTLTVTVTAILTNIHWLARPHVFSWPLILLLLTWLERAERPSLWAFGLLFAGWANLHGAFVFGWLMIGLYGIGHLLESVAARSDSARAAERRRGARLVPVLVVAGLATLLTPYGWLLPWHVVEFFRDPWLRSLTHEFQSPDFHSADLFPFLAALGAMGLLLATGRRPHWTHLVLVLGTAAMALMAQRNIIQFGLIAIPLLALHWGPSWQDLLARSAVARRFARASRTGVTAPYIGAAVLALAVLAVTRGRPGGIEVVPDGFDPRRFPVAAVDQARAAGVGGRVLHEFIWGGYLLWAWPEQKVFIDGGSDFYGGELLRAHRHVINAQPGWRDSLDAWRIDLLLVRTDGALASEVAREPAWMAWHTDSTATLFRRELAH